MTSLWERLASRSDGIIGEFHGRDRSARLADLSGGSTLDGRLESLRGKSVLLATRDQLPTALSLIELDGVARRLVLCTPDLGAELLGEIAKIAEAEAVVCDADEIALALPDLARYPVTSEVVAVPDFARRSSETTEWVLLTSGTTRAPKLVAHTAASLGGFLPSQPPSGDRCVWSTFYDIRRYGGLQIYLRAVLGGTSLVLSQAGEPTRDFFTRAAAQSVTHLTGTPSHWRRALMSGDAALLAPHYVRLSGEVADQAVLDALKAAYPKAGLAHAFASTEAGVAFEVTDGQEGFPSSLLGEHKGVGLKVEDETLRIRSNRLAGRYLGEAPALIAGDGYVDTGDLVERIDDRYYFRGRRGGVINVGGLKVYPEEVEAVLNTDARVRMSWVRARRNPITGALVVADVVPGDTSMLSSAPEAAEQLKADLLASCRRALPAHKVPAILRLVPHLDLNAAGKLVRPHA